MDQLRGLEFKMPPELQSQEHIDIDIFAVEIQKQEEPRGYIHTDAYPMSSLDPNIKSEKFKDETIHFQHKVNELFNNQPSHQSWVDSQTNSKIEVASITTEGQLFFYLLSFDSIRILEYDGKIVEIWNGSIA